MRNLVLAVAAALAMVGSTACTSTPSEAALDVERALHLPRPRFPKDAIVRASLRHYQTNFDSVGYMYYSETLKKWRFDVVFQYNAASIAAHPGAAEMVEFDFTANDGTLLYSYYFDPNTFAWACFPIPLPKRWSYDYLDDGQYVGIELVNGVPMDVFRNDDVWPGSSIYTYTHLGQIRRWLFDQPFNDYYIDLLEVTPVDVTSWGKTFDIPPTLASVSCP